MSFKRGISVTACDIARRFMGIREIDGAVANPQILAMLQLHNDWPQDDSVPWCSAFCAYVCWILGVTHSKSLLARSWLHVGYGIPIQMACEGFDIVVLKRGEEPQPGPTNVTASGHVGFYIDHDEDDVWVLGGNQGDTVSIVPFPMEKVLGVRRVYG